MGLVSQFEHHGQENVSVRVLKMHIKWFLLQYMFFLNLIKQINTFTNLPPSRHKATKSPRTNAALAIRMTAPDAICHKISLRWFVATRCNNTVCLNQS